MKIVTIVGARPQFIKAATLSRQLKNYPSVSEVLVHTGQHYDQNMSDVFFDEMEIPTPAYHLNIGGCGHGMMTGRMLEAIEGVLQKERPDWVLVYGDTNSTLAGALAASKLHIPVAHVEAGLRSFNRKMPEEINRILTDHCADLLLTPTVHASKQLHAEGISLDKIVHVGDIMYETALYFQNKAHATSQILAKFSLDSKSFVLATIHRAENTDDPDYLQQILTALNVLAQQIKIVMPLHPRTRAALEKISLPTHPSILLLEPVGYMDMLLLEANAQAILTDSGGVQKEAYFFKTPCLTLRNETEWVELVKQGTNVLVNPSNLIQTYQAFVSKKFDFSTPFYGTGRTSEIIIQALTLGKA